MDQGAPEKPEDLNQCAYSKCVKISDEEVEHEAPLQEEYEGAAAGRGRKKKGIERASRDENATGKGAGVRGEGVQRNVICFCGFLLENTKRQVEKNVFVLQN